MKLREGSLRMQLREIVQGLAEQKMKMDESKNAIVQQESVVKKLANTVGTNSDEYGQAKIQLDSMKMGLQQATAAMSVMEMKGVRLRMPWMMLMCQFKIWLTMPGIQPQ